MINKQIPMKRAIFVSCVFFKRGSWPRVCNESKHCFNECCLECYFLLRCELSAGSKKVPCLIVHPCSLAKAISPKQLDIEGVSKKSLLAF